MYAPARPLIIALALVTTISVSVAAADTGTVSGAAFDQNGQPVADATVRISGEPLPIGRTVQTGANGLYQFQYLPPGEYIVEIEKSGVGRLETRGHGRGGQGYAGRLRARSFDSGRVDGHRGAADRRHPVGRGRVQLHRRDAQQPSPRTHLPRPVSADSRRRGQSKLGRPGGRRQPAGQHCICIDGANITSPAFGYLSTEVNELDIAEVNIKRGGISAEFGRTAGTVVNAVSRSGTNRFPGVGRVDWLSKHLVGGYKLPADLLGAGVRPGVFRDALLTTEMTPALGIGGPIIRDRMFFYASARYSRANEMGSLQQGCDAAARRNRGRALSCSASSRLFRRRSIR